MRLLQLLQPERRDHLANRHLAGDSFASRTPLTPVHPLTPTTSVLDTHVDTNPIRWPNILNGIFPDVKCLPQRSMYLHDTYCHSCTTQYRTHSVDRCEAANHGSISCTSNSVFFLLRTTHCFCNIPKLLNFYFCCLYSTGIPPPTPLL